MAKIKKTKVDGALVYPATIFPAVKDPNTGQTLTEKLSELGSNVAHDGNGLIERCENNVYYANYAEVGQVASLAKYPLEGWKSIIIKCKENDRFKITGTGASTARLYSFLSETNIVIKVAGWYATLSNEIVICPKDATKLVYCTDTVANPNSDILFYTDTDNKLLEELSILSDEVSKKANSSDVEKSYNAYLNAPFRIDVEGNNVSISIVDWIVVNGKPFYTGGSAYKFSFDFSLISGGYAKVVYDLKTKTASVIPYSQETPSDNIVLVQFGLTATDIRYVFANRYIYNGVEVVFDASFVENQQKVIKETREEIARTNAKIEYPNNKISEFEDGVGYVNYQEVGTTADWSKISDSTVATFKSKIFNCKEGDKFIITGKGLTTVRLWSIVDSNNIVLSVAGWNQGVDNYTLEIPSGGDRICICTDMSGEPNSSVVYIPKDSIYNNISGAYNLWENKKCCFLGDSITYGEGTHKTYWQYLKESLSIIPTSYGVSGARMNYLYTNEIPLAIESGIKFDAIFVFAGTNDFGNNVQIGNWYTESEESANINGSTVLRKKRTFNNNADFKGSINNVLGKLKEEYPDSKIIILTPIHRGKIYFSESNQMPGEDYANGIGLYIDDYVGAIKEAADIWGVYCIDLFSLSRLYPMIEGFEKYFSGQKDLLHPNALGHEVIAKTIERYLSII